MALVICIVLDPVKISTSLILLLLGVTTDRATEVVKIRFDLFKLRKSRRYQIDVFDINKIH